MNTGVHVSFGIMVFSRYMGNSGIAGSCGSFIDDNHSYRWKSWGAISLSFWFVLPRWLECWTSFHIPISHLPVFSGFMFINQIFCYWIVCVLWICHFKVFSPFQWAAFSFCWWFPLLCKTSLVWYSLFLLLFPLPVSDGLLFIPVLYSEKKVMIYFVFTRWIPFKPSFIAWCFSLHVLLALSCSCGNGFLMLIFKYTDGS